MTPRGKSADASFYYHEDASADVASMDSSAVYGNLADAMKDSIVLFPDRTTVGSQPFMRQGSDEHGQATKRVPASFTDEVTD